MSASDSQLINSLLVIGRSVAVVWALPLVSMPAVCLAGETDEPPVADQKEIDDQPSIADEIVKRVRGE